MSATDGGPRLALWRRFNGTAFKAVGSTRVLGWDPTGAVLHLTPLHTDAARVERWDARTGEHLPPIDPPSERRDVGEREGQAPVARSPDGSLSVVRSDIRDPGAGFLLQVLRADGVLVAPLAASGLATARVFSRDGRRVIAGVSYGEVVCWEAATGARLWSARPYDDFSSETGAVVRAADDGGYFAIDRRCRLSAISDAGEVRWRAALLTDKRASESRLQLLPSPDGALLAVGIEGRTPRIFDAATGADRTPVEGHHGRLDGLALSRDGRLAASVDDQGEVRVYDLARDETRWALEADARVSGLAFGPDGRSLWTAGPDGNVRRWNLATGSEEATRPVWPHAPVNELVAARDGARLLVACGHARGLRLQLWSDQRAAPALWSQRIKDTGRFEAAFNDDETRVVVAAYVRSRWSLAFLDASNGRPIGAPEAMPGRLLGLRPTDDGPLWIGHVDARLVVRETGGARRVVAEREGSAAVAAVAVSADGRWMALADGDDVELWSLAPTAHCVARVRPAGELDEVARVVLSHDGGLLVVGTACGVVAVYARTEA